MKHSDLPRSVVVVGAGLAGLSTCERLRELGYDGRLTLLGAEEEPPYERPALSKDLLQGKRSAGEALLRPEGWFADKAVDLRPGVAVQRIAPAEGRVVLAGGTAERADAVVLAIGGRPRTPRVPGAPHPELRTLRTLRDAEALRERLAPGVRLGVVGAGLVGAEVAASAVALGCSVTLLAPNPHPLARVLGTRLAGALHDQHRANGVRVLEGALAAVEDLGEGVRLRLGDGRTVPCDVAVVGVGMVPDVALAADAGIETAGGVLVDNAQRTSNPHVFAAGDVARTRGPDGVLPPSEHWDAALNEGRAAAAAILGGPVPAPRSPWFWSDRYQTHLEVVGQVLDAETTAVRGVYASDSFSALAVRDGRCVGAVAVNRPMDVRAARRLIERGRPVDLARLADESVDLRALTRA
ncbi:NAD(P)/FAD-dependent oxidoreductase [Allonocardiopsis opalescens]|uniref:NAD/ferredoxin-dependent reductase-like protein n=1 Tax=Allonocardiopsis opalescens TaxID=1144618 RepID=A0A2T0PZM2_9ACTN|nr:FAD-dependent oxidoreductase [Allonocardiopsis opalescens]PRX97002.1 NAD/ferredoxin-dependent reductase-like protein [Allonocardiopsis opalescens]